MARPGRSPFTWAKGRSSASARGGRSSIGAARPTGCGSGQGGYRLRTHGGRVPVPWLIGTAGWAMFVHQPYGRFDLTGTEGRSPRPTQRPRCRSISSSWPPATRRRSWPNGHGSRDFPRCRRSGARLSAVAPHARKPRRSALDREDVSREEAPLRCLDLPRHRILPLGLEHRARVVHLQPVGVPRPQGRPRRTARDALPRRAARRDPVEVDRRERGGCSRGRPTDGGGCRRLLGCSSGRLRPGRGRLVARRGGTARRPSRLSRNRMYWEGPQLDRPERRPYALHRNGYAGMQRYGAFLWSGDVDSSWETLKTHIPIAINTSLTGIPYWGTDIGGFVPTKELTGELYVRWFQFGAFCPLFRSHGRTWKLRLPWGWDTGELGPNEIRGYGYAANPGPDELHNAEVEPICRKYLELRYRLMPYLYSVAREGSETGLPIIRALAPRPRRSPGVARGDEFLWGPNLLVSPVTEKGADAAGSICPADTGTTSGPVSPSRAAARSTGPSTWRPSPCMCGPGRSCRWSGPAIHRRECGRPVDVRVYPGARALPDLRRRRRLVRLPTRRLDGHRPGVGRPRAAAERSASRKARGCGLRWSGAWQPNASARRLYRG